MSALLQAAPPLMRQMTGERWLQFQQLTPAQQQQQVDWAMASMQPAEQQKFEVLTLPRRMAYLVCRLDPLVLADLASQVSSQCASLDGWMDA